MYQEAGGSKQMALSFGHVNTRLELCGQYAAGYPMKGTWSQICEVDVAKGLLWSFRWRLMTISILTGFVFGTCHLL